MNKALFSCCVELTLTHSVWMNQYLCLRESAREDKCKKKKKKKAKGGRCVAVSRRVR